MEAFAILGFVFWAYSICSNRKTHEDFETKGNSRRGLQRRAIHQTNLLNHCGVEHNSELNSDHL